jgi:SAM-dependent methyltransferase
VQNDESPLSGDVVQPSPWVERFVHLIRAGGTVLDLAAGSGRHAHLLLEQGFSVVAVDRNLAPLSANRHTKLSRLEVDLEADDGWPFADRTFDGIVVTNYLWRGLFDGIVASVASDGVLIYETFAEGHEAYGRPRRPEFLLQPGELLARVSPRLEVVAYEHGFCEYPSARVVQRVCAIGRSRRMSECPLEPALVES